MTTKKTTALKIESFKKLWKTKKALENVNPEVIEVVKEYWTKTHKPQGNVCWRDIADRVFSEYVRLINADDKGMCKCVTCGATMPWTEIQNGHFITRGNMRYRFDIMNANCQCYKCNCILNGNYQRYTMYMIERYGMEMVEFMMNDKTTKEYKQYEYEEMLVKRYKEIKAIKQRLKTK